jgi:hypothetical protein
MILRRYTNANGDQQEICLSQEDWEKVTEESLEMMLGFKNAPEPVVEAAPEPVVEEDPVAVKAPAKKRK